VKPASIYLREHPAQTQIDEEQKMSTTNEDTQRYEFASTEFVAAFRAYMEEQFADKELDGVSFGYSWIATNAPPHLCREGTDIAGFHWRIRDGKCEIGRHPLPDGENDFHFKADYELLRSLLKLTDEEGSPILNNDMQQMVDDGKVELHWDDDQMIPLIGRYIMMANWRDNFFARHIA
jgi:hypothetical protein